MLLAALHNVDKFYGGQTVLAGATLELRDGDRIALIGRNGAGKTTVLRLLAGLEPVDGGQVYRRDDVLTALLRQDPAFGAGVSVAEVGRTAFVDLDALEARLGELERAGLDDPEVFERWELLHERFERRGGYERRARRDAVLHALGFRGREDDPAERLSGGEKTRLGLAQLLMQQPDVLLLDEPTNHLDLEMRSWLEGYLGRYPGAALVVSHDRAFLDLACGATAEVDRGALRTHPEPPSPYREARARQLEIEARTRANQERERDRLDTAAQRMKLWAGNNEKLARRAKAIERRVERYEAGMIDAPQRAQRTTRFRFPCGPSGELVVQAEHLSKSYERPLFEDVSLVVRQGERVALLGPNGAGKTTFLRVVLGDEPSDDPRGRVRFGARVRVGYYDQELRGVDPEATLVDELVRLVGEREAHDLLGRFLFPFDAQSKRVADLSGGERARLALLKLTLEQANLLVLDEPTNHLDVEMIEALEAALAAFEGTLVVVSHDRRFVEAVTDTVWELRDGGFERYDGGLADYRRKRAARERLARETETAEAAPSDPAAREERSGPSRWQLERERDELEARIAALERDLDELAALLAEPGERSLEALSELGERHTRSEAELLECIARWSEIDETLTARPG